MEVELTEAERDKLFAACTEAAKATERIHAELVPHPDMANDIRGTRGLKRFVIIWSVAAGLVSLLIWRYVADLFSVPDVLMAFGVPRWAAQNVPEVLALFAAATGAWLPMYSWGVEGRLEYLTKWLNATQRASVLHSVIEELSERLPGAVPDMDDYAHNLDDDRQNNLVEIALGRRKAQTSTPQPRRRDPPLRRA